MASKRRRSGRGLSRREFLYGSSALLAGCAAAPAVITDPKPDAELRFAIIGLNQRGAELRRALALVANSRVSVLCDVDDTLLAREKADAEKGGAVVDTERDMRRVFERDDVDAVLISTPNHWHALAGIWALQAGKHVYVEKPVSHSIWEGRQLAAAARKSGRIAQSGTQDLSDSGLRGFVEWKKHNDLGAVRWAHAVWYRVREPIGKAQAPLAIPASIDHDLFCGPRSVAPVMRTHYHYDWHWQWPYGNGEIGNLGSHLTSAFRGLLDVGHPKRVLTAGARLLWIDDGETPNVSLSVFDYGAFPVVLELRNLPLVAGGNVGPTLRGRGSGVLIRYDRGWFFTTRANSTVYGADGAVLATWRGDAGKEHLQNFAEAIRRNDPSLLRAPLEDSVQSAAACHFANIAWRVGREAALEEVREAVGSCDPAHSVIDALPAHMAANGVDLARTKLRLGGWLSIAGDGSTFTGGANVDQANALLREEYREPFVVPELV